MRRSRSAVILVLAGLAALLAGCSSFPTQVLLDPARFENDAIRVEWAIGINFFRIKLTNITDAQIDLDLVHGAVFGTDILGRLNAESEDRYPMPANLSSDDRVFLKGHTGETIRLYLTEEVRGKKTVYDISYKIAGATRVGSRAEAAAGPAQPVAQPAAATKGKP